MRDELFAAAIKQWQFQFESYWCPLAASLPRGLAITICLPFEYVYRHSFENEMNAMSMTMTRLRPSTALLLSLSLAWSLSAALGQAQEVKAEAKGKTVELGKFKITAPAEWKQQQPKSRILAYEFSAPAAEGDKTDGRMTVMAAGGSVEDNINRWYGQFTQPDGGSTKDKAKVEKRTIAGQEVHIVDLSGTFKDQAGPFAPAVEREKYRMLAAIIVTEEANFFVKFYGPQRTIAEEEKAFRGMINSLSAK